MLTSQLVQKEKKRTVSPTDDLSSNKKKRMDLGDNISSDIAKEKKTESTKNPSSVKTSSSNAGKQRETTSSETASSKPVWAKSTKSAAAEKEKKKTKMDEKSSSKPSTLPKSPVPKERKKAATAEQKKSVAKESSPSEEFEFFFGKKIPFSQHYPAKFQVNGVTYNCAEQYMMHQKAVLFKDAAMAKQIMATDDPVQQKRLGRKVQNFNKDRWAQRSLEVVKEASLAKFSQNPDLLQTLLATHPRTMVEAAPRDRLWGIGMGASKPKARDPTQWRGRNLLGKILTQVREELRAHNEGEKSE
ncbi:hypothetical protein V1264_001395 [Littorina saxatilis]